VTVQEAAFMKAVEQLRGKDPRYHVDAYLFVREALDFTVKMLNKPNKGPSRHVTATELLDGIRLFGLQEFGPMTLTVFKTWGIQRTEDFGEIVFNLVESGVLGKTEQDNKGDFAKGYNFSDAFASPFLPTPGATRPTQTPRRKGLRRKVKDNATAEER
jgi:uncharacterized repeat protein (TIGR04138 family)